MAFTRRRARVTGGLALVLAIAVGGWLLRGSQRPPPAASNLPAAPRSSRPDAPHVGELAAVSRVVPPPPPANRAVAPPVIDEIEVEKTEVCEGEDNLITVRAHTVDGNDAFLHYTVGSMAGNAVPVRTYLRTGDARPPPLAVTVFSKDNVATTAPVPEYRVKDCRPQRLLLVSHRALPNTFAEYELTATVTAAQGGPAFAATRYEWSFGDGTTDETRVPWVVHDYSGRRQRTAYAYTLVEVKAFDAAGDVVRGRVALAMHNAAFESRQRGVIVLFAEPTPRFPAMGPGNVVRQTFRLWHDEDVPVVVRTVTLRLLTASAGGGTASVPPPREVDVSAWFDRREVPPGPGLAQAFQYDFGAEPDVYAVTLDLTGATSDGRPARGRLTLMRPPPKPTRDNSIPVDDPALVARIKKALSILGQDSVSEEDLRRLEREGKL